jgi:hypothetical protein
MAIEKTIKLNVDAQEALKELTKLGNVFEEDYQNADNLTAEIGALEDALYEMARAGKQGTKEFDALAAEVGKAKKTIIETDMVIDGMSQTMAQNLGGALGGITAGFELGAGVMGAFGVESEKVEEALLKVQSAMAIAQGVQGIREAIPAFRNLGKTAKAALSGIRSGIAATGIGLFVVALGTIVAYWDDIKKAVSGVSEEQQKLNELNQKNAEAQIEKLNAIEGQTNQLKLQGKSEKEILEIKNRQIDAAIEEQEISIETAKMTLQAQLEAEKRNKSILEGILLFLTSPLQILLGTIDTISEGLVYLGAIEEGLSLRASMTESLAETIFDPTDVEETGNELIKEQEKVLEELKERRAGNQLAITDIERNGSNERIDIARQEFDAKIAEYLRLKQLDEDLAQWQKQHDEEELARKKQMQDEIDAYLDAELAKEEAIINAQIEADKIKEELAQAELEREIALKDAKLSLASETFGALGELVQAFAGQSEEQQRRAFNIQKAISIAQAVIDTYKGANAIFASAAANPGTVLFPAQPFIAAGAAIAAGLANVATIARQEFNPGGGGASTGAGGGGGASNPPAALSSPATFNVVGNTGTNQLAETLGQQPLQAYVVAGDVTTAQSLERNKIQQSTL